MTIHSSLPPRNEEGLPETVTVRYSLQRMAQFAQSFNSKIGWVDPEGISPFAPLGISIGARMQWSRWVESGDEEALTGARELKEMLSVFGGRWRCVCEFFFFLQLCWGFLKAVIADLVVFSQIYGLGGNGWA